ncbi:MAG: hypothetical protein MMC33_010111 [Icmadophila ericetorum]|nr:hypothetical protein [Icmadophila ericetorum]
MARLNDPPVASLDSIEALKRRFIRQNREIARVNSTQAIRIQNLEVSNSAIIAENLVLREQVIKLQYELDRGSSRATVAKVNAVKDKVEAKLVELGNLVAELGKVRSTKRESTARQKSAVERHSPQRSPGSKAWRSAGIDDCRLPPILENKLYPRKTLDTEELRGILSDSATQSESPDVGPPPVASFEKASPLKYSNISKSIESINKDSSSSTKPINMEARRKRRESSSVKDIRRLDLADLAGEPEKLPKDGGTIVLGQSLKTGAKRKFSARDEEELNLPIQTIDEEEFPFGRQAKLSAPERPLSTKNASSSVISHSNSRVGNERVGSQTSKERLREPLATAKSRRALGEKSVNTDPMVSPVKRLTGRANETISVAKKDANRRVNERDDIQGKDFMAKTVNNLEKFVKPESILQESIPEKGEMPAVTPGPPDLDLLSPAYTEPSAARAESRDTPPPSDLHPNATTAEGRLSRRSRSSVSYAEPSLRAKMRRPTKELVDAVGADERIQRAISVKPDLGKIDDECDMLFERAADKPRARTVVIKKEDGTTESTDWKTLPQTADLLPGRPEPTSPLQHKTMANDPTADLPTSVVTDRRRRPSALLFISDETSPNLNDLPTSGPSWSVLSSNSTITALVAGSKKSARGQSEAQETIEKVDGLGSKPVNEDQPDIYEVQESPATNAKSNESKSVASNSASNKSSVRGSRRSSSVSDLGVFKKGGSNGGEIRTTASTGTGTGASTSYLKDRRRRDTMVGNASTGAGENRPLSAASDANSTSTKGSATSVSARTSTAVVATVTGKGDKDSIGRNERAAQRRKSMML